MATHLLHVKKIGPDLGKGEDIQSGWLNGVETVGITAGASAPEVLVDNVIAHLGELGETDVETLGGMREDVVFVLPKNLRQLAAQAEQ